MLGGEHCSNATVEFEQDLHDKPLNLLHKKVCWLDGRSQRITEYTIVDCGTSVLNGNYVVLEDGQGGRKQITGAEFHEIWDAQL